MYCRTECYSETFTTGLQGQQTGPLHVAVQAYILRPRNTGFHPAAVPRTSALRVPQPSIDTCPAAHAMHC